MLSKNKRKILDTLNQNSVTFENTTYLPEEYFNKVASIIDSEIKTLLEGIFEAQLLSVKSRFPYRGDNALDFTRQEVQNWLEEFVVRALAKLEE